MPEPEALLPDGELWDADAEVVWLPVADDDDEPVAVTRVDGRLVVVVVQEVTSDAVEDVGIGLVGVSEREMDDDVVVVAVSVPGVQPPGVSELEEAVTETVCEVVDVTDVVLREVAVSDSEAGGYGELEAEATDMLGVEAETLERVTVWVTG